MWLWTVSQIYRFILRFKYTTKFSLPKIACPAIVYAEIVVVIDPFFVGVCLWIKVYCYNPTEICQQRLQGVRNVAQKLCSWERSLRDYTGNVNIMKYHYHCLHMTIAGQTHLSFVSIKNYITPTNAFSTLNTSHFTFICLIIQLLLHTPRPVTLIWTLTHFKPNSYFTAGRGVGSRSTCYDISLTMVDIRCLAVIPYIITNFACQGSALLKYIYLSIYLPIYRYCLNPVKRTVGQVRRDMAPRKRKKKK